MIPFALAILTALPTPDLKLTVEVVGGNPLPFQAVRLRVTVENVGEHPTPRLRPLEATACVVGIRRAGKTEFAPLVVPRVVKLEENGDIICLRLGIGDSTFSLRPGERLPVAFPIGTHLGDPEKLKPRAIPSAEPLFPEPGTYALRCQYTYGYEADDRDVKNVSVYGEVTVEVGKPAGKDKKWADALARDAALVRVLLQPAKVCTVEQAESVRRLLEDAPDSTYADYGRLALARHYLRRKSTPEIARVEVPKGIEILEKLAERKEAAGFPFLPHVRLNLARADNKLQDYVTFLMNRDYRDSVEWIEDATSRMNAEEWAKFRKPLPAKK
jgi:hypothetical protein